MKIISYINKKHKYYQEFMFGKRARGLATDLILDKWEEEVKFIKNGNKKIGLYIHIPYCQSACYFCDCFSIPGLPEKVDKYTDDLIKEIKKFAPIFSGVGFDTLYFGGGTPSILSENVLDKLLRNLHKYFNFKKTHSSFEGCPKTLNKNKLDILKKYNISRLTIGVQSLDRKVLRSNNRSFTPKESVKELVKKCKKLGILVNLELICGLKDQSQDSLLNDVTQIINIKPNQIHLYYFEHNPATLIWHNSGYKGPTTKERISWRNQGLKILERAGYKTFPFSGPADQFDAINVQIYNNKVHNASLIGIGNGAISNINDNFRYGSIFSGNKFIYKKLLKRFIKYAEIFNI